jgi:hypothetical protein
MNGFAVLFNWSVVFKLVEFGNPNKPAAPGKDIGNPF